MNLAHSISTLHILTKPVDYLPTETHNFRHLEAQQGIIWETVAPLFLRHGWQVEEATSLFLKAYQAESEQKVIVSKMGQGQVLVNDYRQVFGISNLHEIEALAENQMPQAQAITKRPWLSELVANLKQLIS